PGFARAALWQGVSGRGGVSGRCRRALQPGGHRSDIPNITGSRQQRGPVMAEAIAERVRRYILDGCDEDHRRLLGVAETTQETARAAFRRVGMQEGWHAIDCGCG